MLQKCRNGPNKARSQFGKGPQKCLTFYQSIMSERWCLTPNLFVLLSHLLQVCVTPNLPISKDSGDHATLAVVLEPLSGGAPLQGTDLPAACAAHIYWQQQLAAGQPEDRMASGVIDNF